MRNTAFHNLKPSKLRKLMLLCFFALAVPTFFLVYKSYDQLKWEAFYQHRVLAEALSKAIDEKFLDLIQTEQRRAFSDYAFATADKNNTTLLKRSPLSTLPIENADQGVIGYFQINANGEFSTPFLPTNSNAQNQYVLAVDDKTQRELIHDQIQKILTSNKLVEPQEGKQNQTELAETTSFGADNAASLKKTSASLNQAAFDRLSDVKESPPQERISKNRKNDVLSRLEELETTSPYQEKVNLRQSKALAAKKAKSELSKSVYEKKEHIKNTKEVTLIESQTLSPSNINLFKNDTDPFEISLLNSGHFVLYRKVWRNEQRFIQGILLDQ